MWKSAVSCNSMTGWSERILTFTILGISGSLWTASAALRYFLLKRCNRWVWMEILATVAFQIKPVAALMVEIPKGVQISANYSSMLVTHVSIWGGFCGRLRPAAHIKNNLLQLMEQSRLSVEYMQIWRAETSGVSVAASASTVWSWSKSWEYPNKAIQLTFEAMD